MTRSLSTYLLTIFLLIWGNPLEAQQVRGVTLTTLALDKSIEGLYYHNDGKPTEMALSRTLISAPFTYTGTRGIIFYATEEDLRNKGPEAARVILPLNAERVLLLVGHSVPGEEEAPAEEAETPAEGNANEDPPPAFEVTPVDMATEGYRAGDYRVINLSTHMIDLSLGEEKASIEIGEQVTLTSSEWSKNTTDLDFLAEITDEGGSKQRVKSSVWGHRPERRYIILLQKSDQISRPVVVRSFFDVPK